MDKLALSTLYEVVLPIYPKAPEHHIQDTFKAIDGIYQSLLEEVDAKHIVIMGDGTGGISTKLRSTTWLIINHYLIKFIYFHQCWMQH